MMNLRNTKIIHLAIVFITFAVATGHAGAISLTQSIDKDQMAFEDSAKFEITVEWPGPQFAYRFTNPLNPYFDRLKVGRFSSSVNSTGTGQDEVTTKKFTYVLTPTSSGPGKIDPITISFISWPDSVAGELVTEPVSIIIADQKPAPKSKVLPIWVWITGGMAILGGGAAFYVSKSRAAKRKPVVKSPSEIALEELAGLKTEAGTDLKKFQTGVYNILVKYVNSKYQFNLGGQTEDKLEEIITKIPLNEQQRNSLKGWVIQAERDKYRPLASSPGDTVRLETDLRRFFEELNK